MDAEGLSRLMDDDLDDAAARRAVRALLDDPVAREAWALWHAAGDALREEPVLSAGFGERLRQRLAEEPTVLAPAALAAAPASTPGGRLTPRLAFSLAASFAVMAMVGVATLRTPTQDAPAGGVLSVSAEAPPPPQVLDLPNPYMAAHQDLAPSTDMDHVSPWLHTIALK